LEAERIALYYAEQRGLPVVVLQPTAVYGPFAPVWTTEVIEQLSRGRLILVDGGEGICNAIYIDDLIRAMLLAATKEGIAGEVFLISGESSVTWREFFGSYEHMLGVRATVSMSSAEAKTYWEQQNKGMLKELINLFREDPIIRQRIFGTRKGAALKRFAQSVVPVKVWGSMKKEISVNGGVPKLKDPDRNSIIPLTPEAIEFYRSKRRVSIDKAKQLLGFRPAFDLQTGMRLTEKWAQWANLLNRSENDSQRTLR
jgi:nucleoside-diphosphate-sugar epimerase